jgi:hypothetical protein
VIKSRRAQDGALQIIIAGQEQKWGNFGGPSPGKPCRGMIFPGNLAILVIAIGVLARRNGSRVEKSPFKPIEK